MPVIKEVMTRESQAQSMQSRERKEDCDSVVVLLFESSYLDTNNTSENRRSSSVVEIGNFYY